MRCKSTDFFLISQIICCNFVDMKKKIIQSAGLISVATGVGLFAIHGLLLPHNNLLLLSGLTLVLAGVVAHVVITKRSSKY